MSTSASLNPSEWRAVGSLGTVFYLRMLGLFLVLPVLSPYASDLSGSRPLLVGLAVGAFPLTQTLLQIPFGWFSDKIGRKPVIVLGLTLFIIGSLLAAVAQNIFVLIAAFFLQGAGAIGSVIIALVADLTRDAVRTRTMAVIGGAIGLAVGTGFIGGPLLASYWSVPAIFYLIAALAAITIPVVLFVVPSPKQSRHRSDVQMSSSHASQVFRNLRLWKYNGGIFFCNTTLRGLFVVLPFLIHEVLSPDLDWALYLSTFTISGVVMFPTIFFAEREGYLKQALMISSVMHIIGLLILPYIGFTLIGLFLALSVYFSGFSLLEALLPSLVSREATEAVRGTAMGTFNMSQYLGGGLGGVYGGLFLVQDGTSMIPQHTSVLFFSLALLGAFWTLWIVNLKLPPSRKSDSTRKSMLGNNQ